MVFCLSHWCSENFIGEGPKKGGKNGVFGGTGLGAQRFTKTGCRRVGAGTRCGMVAPAGKAKEGRGEKRSAPIPITVRLKARSLYVLKGLPAEQVAEACGLETSQVHYLSNYYGWSKARREMSAQLSKGVDTKELSLATETGEAIATECEEIALSGLEKARSALSDTSKDAAKNFQAWTAGVRNLATARNLVRSIGGADTGNGKADTRSVNLFFVSGKPVQEKQVDAEV